MVPTHMFLTRGVGVHREKLASFEQALRSAGVAYCNLVSVSSILPPNCKIIPRKRGEKLLNPGEITHCVMARSETNERNRLISASIGLAIPTDRRTYGYLSEHHAHGETDEETGEYTEDLAAQMLATTLGVEFDPDYRVEGTRASVQDGRQDRADIEHYAVGHWKTGAMDNRRCVGGVHSSGKSAEAGPPLIGTARSPAGA